MFNVGATSPCRTPYAETFMCAQSSLLGKVKQPAKISASYLYASWSGKGRGGKERGREREDMDGRRGMHEENLVKSQK